nr:hypothetical protein [Mycobacterium hackensackense]
MPSSRLTRAGEVRPRAHICTQNANTVHATARYTVRIHPLADTRVRDPSWPPAAANRAHSTVTVASWTNVVAAGSLSRRAVVRSMTVTWTARSTAATPTSRSPAPGAAHPPDWVSSAQPSTAHPAAA